MQAKKFLSLLALFITYFLHPFVLDKPGTYELKKTNNAINLLHTDFDNHQNVTRLFNMQDISITGAATNQDIIERTFFISADYVTFNLSGFNITGGISIDEGKQQITILNGLIDGLITFTNITTGFDRNFTTTDVGIRVNANCRDIYIDNVTVRNAIKGIEYNQVSGGSIAHCDLLFNTTAVELEQSYNIIIEDCTATANTNAGFCLISSTTNIIKNSKALSTGQGNEEIVNQTIFGFVSADGYGNIFERCIANATQALSTTDSQSLVAGFALRGSESCSKIIECESANTQTNVSGVTVPYGILLEAQRTDPITTFTSTSPAADPDATINAVAWSSDGKYLAVGGVLTGQKDASVFLFDRVAGSLIEISSGINAVVISAISWSPDNNYLAVGGDFGTDGLRVYEFDGAINNLLDTKNVSVNAVSWSPDGNYLAVGGASGNLRVYEFDRIANVFINEATGSLSGTVHSISWSPDGKYLAVGGTLSGNDLRVYEFDRAANSLINELSYPLAAQIFSVEWSPDGNYLAVGGNIGVTSLRVYEFDRAANNLINETTASLTGSVLSVSWSPDGNYLAAGGTLTGDDLRIYNFDRLANSLTNEISSSLLSSILSLDWSPDGGYLAVGIDSGDTNPDIYIFDVLTFPSKNVITNNTVYCNLGARYPSGVGISGSSIANLIIQNTAYSNPIPMGPNAPIVGSNYYFVTNVFNPLFGNAPTLLQNISVDGCVPICMPVDQVLLAKQIRYKICELESQQDIMSSIVDTIMGGAGCNATQITGATAINSAGIYCVGNMIAGAISISASDVQLDLSNYRVTGGVSVGSGVDNIVIKNGIVENSGSDAIKVNSGSSNITIQDVRAKNSLVGINFDNVQKGIIKNCSLTQNTTGLQLNSSHNVVIDSCIADCNLNAGFDLINSTTNIIQNSKSLSTGQGNNNVLDQTIFGFVSSDGHGNIFERCIANSTQGLSTTDSNSLVAGFALRGSEGCTKIIECESANAQTNVSGVTVPYGILLEANADDLLSTVTHTNLAGDRDVFVSSVAWSPDGIYLALAAIRITIGNLWIYQFDRLTDQLIEVDYTDFGGISPVETGAVAWSPDGLYVAVGIYTGASNIIDDVWVYRFDRSASKLIEVDHTNLGGDTDVRARGISWSPNGLYLAVGANTGAGDANDDLWVYSFDRVSEKLAEFAHAAVAGLSNNADLYTISWSPDGNYLALAGAIVGDDVWVYSFNPGSATVLQQVAHVVSGSSTVYTVAWSPDGKYLAIGGNNVLDPTQVRVYQFDPVAVNPLVSIASALFATDARSVFWSPDGQYLAVGGTRTSGDGEDLLVYRFDSGVGALYSVANTDFDGDTTVRVNSVAWSPDGVYIAAGVDTGGGDTTDDVWIFEGFNFPSKNIIKNNTVYCNSGGSIPSGIGISGSSIQNLIIGNTSYNNPHNPFMVEQNYAFVTNVFNPLFSYQPTELQNLSIAGCEPITIANNPIITAQQIVSKLDFGLCGPTSLTSSDISGGTISLTEAGTYCIASDLTTDVSITTTCVYLDLNHHCITGIISIATADDVTVTNGTLTPPAPSATPSAAITVASTANRVQINVVNIVCAASTGDGITGRDGIEVMGNDTHIFDCTIMGGAASDKTTAGVGVRGGHGILLSADATKPIITYCTISSGNGGDANGAANNGGDGGDGVHVADGCVNAQVNNNLIFITGTGGDGGASATGGRGGDGMKVESGAVDTEVRDNKFRNTGAGGDGGTSGVGGKAVDDDVTVTVNLSQVFSNFAHNIASATKFDLQATGFENGILTPNPPTSTAINPFANVFT